MLSTFSKTIIAALALGAVDALPQGTPPAGGNTPIDNTELLGKLITETTAISRYRRLLTKNGEEVITGADLVTATTFDFNKNGIPVPGSNGGANAAATLETFPILSNADFTISIVSLGPCGLFVPHVHPRANEFFLVIDGEVDFGYMLELGLLKNGAPNPEIPGKLTKNVGTFFPQGSIHYQNNPTCDPMTAVVILDNKDPGSTPIVGAGPATGNGTVVPRQTGGRDFEMFRPLLPAFIVSEVDKCFARCGM